MMKNKTILMLLLFIPIYSFGDSLELPNLKIETNKPWTVPKGIDELRIRKLEMKRDSEFFIPSTTRKFKLVVTESILEGRVAFIGLVTEGTKGSKGKDRSYEEDRRADGSGHGGAPGRSGARGGNGPRGAELDLDLGLISPVPLKQPNGKTNLTITVVSRGGACGAGGSGGKGGPGADAGCGVFDKRGAKGGKGGYGGGVGNPGSGGDIVVKGVSEKKDLINVETYSNPGEFVGKGGKGGKGGPGGAHAECTFWNRGGGKKGADRPPGSDFSLFKGEAGKAVVYLSCVSKD